MKLHETVRSESLFRELSIDCKNCSGLCCTALFFSKMDGFPEDKDAGKPCVNLQEDFLCSIHKELKHKDMKGCIAYDCFGAGQKVTAEIYQGKTFDQMPETAKQIFDVFLIVFRMHQMLWFLAESRTLLPAKKLWSDIEELIQINQKVCSGTPEDILDFPIDDYKERVNDIIQRVWSLTEGKIEGKKENRHKEYFGKVFKGKVFDGTDLSGKLLIAADFSGCRFFGTNFLGADTRDTHFEGADLREAVFLTQTQINSAHGNRDTLLPSNLAYPAGWNSMAAKKEEKFL